MMCKVHTDIGGIKLLYHVCPPVRKLIHSLKLVDYLHVQADNPWYNYYLSHQLFEIITDQYILGPRNNGSQGQKVLWWWPNPV